MDRTAGSHEIVQFMWLWRKPEAFVSGGVSCKPETEPTFRIWVLWAPGYHLMSSYDNEALSFIKVLKAGLCLLLNLIKQF